MPLADMQHQLNGIIMGSPGVIRLDNVAGMGTGPKDEKKYPIAGAAGIRWGREQRRGNIVTFDGAIVCPGDPAAAWINATLLAYAFDATAVLATPNGTVEWRYKMPGVAERVMLGRPQTCDLDTGQLALGLVPFVATFECALPVVR